MRAIAHFYRGEDDSCREYLSAIKPESVPARLIPAMHSMLGVKPAAPLTPPEAALVSRTTESSATLRNELEKLDRAFTDDAGENHIFKLVRLAMQECRRILPDQVETLKRLIYVRGSMHAIEGERLAVALQGMPRQDASFFRARAHGMETTGESGGLSRWRANTGTSFASTLSANPGSPRKAWRWPRSTSTWRTCCGGFRKMS